MLRGGGDVEGCRLIFMVIMLGMDEPTNTWNEHCVDSILGQLLWRLRPFDHSSSPKKLIVILYFQIENFMLNVDDVKL